LLAYGYLDFMQGFAVVAKVVSKFSVKDQLAFIVCPALANAALRTYAVTRFGQRYISKTASSLLKLALRRFASMAAETLPAARWRCRA
jgi:hypothetical protein